MNVVGSGTLLVTWVKGAGADTDISVSDGGSNTFTMLPHIMKGPAHGGCFGYILSATANATAAFTAAFTDSVTYRGVCVWQFTPGAGKTVY